MENFKVVVKSLSQDLDLCKTTVSCNKQLDSSGSSTENNDPEIPHEYKYEIKENNETSSKETQVLTDSVTFTRLENNKKKDYKERCRFCSSVFTNPVEFLRHGRTHSAKIMLPLEVIENYYDYPNRTYCPICKEKLKTKNFKSIFIKHLLTHTTTLKYTCAVCKKQFRRKDHMSAHQKRHIVPFDMRYAK